MKSIAIFLCLAVMVVSCSRKNTVTDADTSVAVGYPSVERQHGDPTTLPMNPPLRIMSVPSSNAIPKATAFRMSGDYQDNVAITIDSDGRLTYFPAPTDITADSRPVDLGDGWWLNCQGIGPNSVFTSYTFAKYAELPSVPDPEQLKNSVIPGARVTQFVELPCNINEVDSHLQEIKTYLKDF